MRKVWATCGAAVFLLSEFGAYFEGEIVQESRKHFRQWIVGGNSEQSQSREGGTDGLRSRLSQSSLPSQANISHGQQRNQPPSSFQQSQHVEQEPSVPHDPEILAKAHRLFLSCLSHSILLTDVPYTHALRSLLTHIDELIAFLSRLRVIQANLDLETDSGVVDALANYEDEERVLQYHRLTWRLPDGRYWVGPASQPPPQGAELLGVYYPRGATLGGSTMINAMFTFLPPDSDWDYVVNITGDTSWR